MQGEFADLGQQVAQFEAGLQQLLQARHLLHDRFRMEVGELLEVQLDFQVAIALHRVRHAHVEARRDLGHDLVEVVAVDLDA